jgi:6-phosphofructokinase 1
MSVPQRIGILTGGGDVPGLNSVIKSVTYRAVEMGADVVGFRRGWQGLTHVRPGVELDPDHTRRLDRSSTRTIDRTGGTVLHTSRTNPRRMRAAEVPAWLSDAERNRLAVDEGVYDLTPVVLDHLEALGIDVLVTIGGDDTLSYSRVLTDAGVALVAIPKTMDNDVQGTEYCIGFSTAITRAKEAINRQRTTLGSHERIGVFRIFGRDAGFSALYTAYVTSNRCVIPEAPYDIDRLAAIIADDRADNPSNYAIIITAEGAIWEGAALESYGTADAFGHRRKANVGEALADELRRRTGIEAVASELTYDIRSGEPDSLDSIVATTFANIAMDLIAAGENGRMAAVRDGKYAAADLPDPGVGPRRVDVAALYNTTRFRPRYDGKLGDPMLLVGLGAG